MKKEYIKPNNNVFQVRLMNTLLQTSPENFNPNNAEDGTTDEGGEARDNDLSGRSTNIWSEEW